MKAAEKELIYDLLKKASGTVTGYTRENFLGEVNFRDDEILANEISANANSQSASFSSVQIPIEANSAQDFFAAESAQNLGTTLDSIAKKISACQNCILAKTRKNVVPGEGVPNPAVLVIGEGPGADEDAQGRPFVGKAGQLLDKMLAAINLNRGKNCFIANIVKCRPPMNRDPSPEECAACSSFLQAQIHVLKPKMILAVGRIALQKLLDTSIGITKMHGKILDYNGIPFMATFHPSALLRDESYKRPAWEDLKIFRAKLLELCPNYES
ncbi:MAG: uracil-DNA glycosylase [Treponema sp.]|nr:uracil-DNA glycosylase [Treponema sp.]